jgi:uncharacterized membrane protein YphA (DoxX/SURF4 family)
MDLQLDPLYWHALRWLIAGIFAMAVLHKLSAATAFEEVVRDYRVLPAGVAPFAARLIILLEAGVVLALTTGIGPKAAAVLGIGLLAAYWSGMAINLARGRRDIDCGCFGPAGTGGNAHTLSGWLLLRNLVLIALAALLLLPVAPRELVWLDLTTIAMAATAGIVLYSAVDQIMANEPWIRRLLP